MADTLAPFREAPRVLACPRCGETLEGVMTGVQVCGQCEGVWLAALTLERTFGTPYWPQGASAWWRRELACPACATESRGSQLTPVTAGEVVVDRCIEHGVWLDAGELGRLLGAPRTIELEAFYERLRPDAELPPRLLEFRKQREAERARYAAELAEYRARLEAEHAKRRAAEQAALEAQRLAIAQEVARKRLAELEARRDALQNQRADASANATTHERRVQDLRTRLRDAEAKLDDARARLLELDRQLVEVDRSLRT